MRIQIRRGTAAQWTAANPTLLAGELGVETDTYQIKVGPGVWSTLTYIGGGGGGGEGNLDWDSLTGIPDELQAGPNVAYGYVGLDVNGRVPTAQLPSYVDDVVEGVNLGDFPNTGEKGKIYVAVDTNKTYRWSGSTYVEISPSPGTSDAVVEGTTNLYYTAARSAAVSSAISGVSQQVQTNDTNVRNDFTAALDGKVTKNATVTTVYTVDGTGTQNVLPYRQTASAGSIVQRTGTGSIKTATPAADDEATPRLYVDSGFAKYVGQQLYGTGAPASTLGYNGDTYTDYTAQKKYTKAAGAWTVTTDTTVSKETPLVGTWSRTSSTGTLSDDTTDGMTTKKFVPALNTEGHITYALTAPVNMTGKLLRIPLRMDSMDGWTTWACLLRISDTAGINNNYSFGLLSKDMFRANEVEAFTCCPNLGYPGTTPPNLAAIQYLRFYWQDDNTGTRTAYIGQPVLIG